MTFSALRVGGFRLQPVRNSAKSVFETGADAFTDLLTSVHDKHMDQAKDYYAEEFW